MTIRVGEEVTYANVQDIVVRSMQLLNNGVETYGGEGFALETLSVSQTTETIMRLLRENGITVWVAAKDRRWPKENDPNVFDHNWLVILMLMAIVEQNS